MSGNVAEWEDACDPCQDNPSKLCCQQRGPGIDFDHEVYSLCAANGYFFNTFDYAQDFLGFRCCADLP